MTVVFTDSFTATGADKNLDAWPSAGDPDYAMNNGSGANFQVETSTDRVETRTGATVFSARIIDAAVPSTDQEITADCSYSNLFASGEVHVRQQSGAHSHYALKIELNEANEVRLYRVVAGAHTLIASADRSISGAGSASFRLKATGTNPVALEAQIGATTVVTFNDSSASRFETGVPGIGAWRDTTNSEQWIDNISVDDLAAGGVTITASPGIVLLTSGTQTPKVDDTVIADPGIIVLTAGTHGPGLATIAPPGIITLTASEPTPKVDDTIVADPGIVTLTASEHTALTGTIVSASSGIIQLTAGTHTPVADATVSADPGIILLVGNSAVIDTGGVATVPVTRTSMNIGV